MSVVDEVIKRKQASLDLKDRDARIEAFFIRKRAGKIALENPAASVDELSVQLTAEIEAIRRYLIGKADLLAGNDPGIPKHLDLTDVGKIESQTSELQTSAVRTGIYTFNRKRWVNEIVWRATAIHADLWKHVSPPTLQLSALNELVDRRLHAVELITCIVNTNGHFIDGTLQRWSVAGLNGPWKDNARVRTVEYPSIPKEPPFVSIKSQLLANGWYETKDDFRFRDSFGNETNFPSDIAQSWRARFGGGGAAWIHYVPRSGVSPAAVLRRIFETPREDFLQRSWLYCDMCGSAANLASLAFALERRTGDNHAFDLVANKVNDPNPAHYDAYMALGPVVYTDGPRDIGSLMAHSQDPFFENTAIDFDDLQVGDFTVFWSNRVYDVLSGGAWVNEFSHVMGIDSDPMTGKIRITGDGPQIFFAGHGIHTRTYSGMAAHLARTLNTVLEQARAQTRFGTSPIRFGSTQLVKWAPYESFDAPGPYWVEIPRTVWKDRWLYNSLDEVLHHVPKTVTDSLGGGTGYQPPPDTDAAYFPLFEPAVFMTHGDPWRAYLEIRKSNATFTASKKLDEVHVDGSAVIALFYRGSSKKVPVVRPRVRI